MKHIIPIQEINQIEVECVASNVETNYFKFRINYNGAIKQSIELTSQTIELINKNVKEIVSKISKTYRGDL